MAGILKSLIAHSPAVAAPTGAGLANFNLQDLVESGQMQIAAARREAARIIAEAEEQSLEIKRAAAELGHREGLEKGSQEFQQRVDTKARQWAEADLAGLRKSVEQLWSQEAAWLTEWKQVLVQSILEICERLVSKRIAGDEEILLRWAEEAIEMTRASRGITLAVHPELLLRLGDRLEQLLKTTGAPEDSRLEPDETLSKDGLVVRQRGGEIDLQLKSQLARFALSLNQLFGGG
jgi:flagellar biosynthesis/type III secretory pathway protein FliH